MIYYKKYSIPFTIKNLWIHLGSNTLKTLFFYLKRYRKESILGPLFKLLEAALELIVPLLVAALIDTGIAQGDIPFTIRMCLCLVLFGLVGLAFSLTAQYFAAKAAVGCTADMRAALFSHIHTLSYSDLDTLGASTLITRMTADARQVQTGINMSLRLLLRSPFVVFGAMIMAFAVDATSALTFVVLIPVLSVVVFGILLLSIPLYRKVQASLDRTVLSVRENLTGTRVIRAFRKEEEETEAFGNIHDELTRHELRVGRLSALLNPLTYVLVNGAVVLLLYIGALRVDAGILTAGQVVALYNYMSQILVELIKFADLIITITRTVTCASRMEGIFAVQSSMPMTDGDAPSVAPDAPAIAFSHVSLCYRGAGSNSLSDISFSIRQGETLGIIGGTGSGKSTLVQLIPRLYDATDGCVEVGGHPVAAWPTQALRRRIGIVMQKAVLFRGTVRENLAMGDANATDERMYAALQAAQIKDAIDEKGGLDALITQGGTNLSGGQKQRLSVARALVREPHILILDDASSALDYATDAAMRQAIRSLPFRPTVCIVSQRAASLMHADRILVLDEGHLVGQGTHEELLQGCDVYREIYLSQFEQAPKEETV